MMLSRFSAGNVMSSTLPYITSTRKELRIDSINNRLRPFVLRALASDSAVGFRKPLVIIIDHVD